MAQAPQFSWKNYYKPTPRNIQRIVTSTRKIFIVATGTSVLVNASDWVTLAILVTGAVLEELSNFFGEVAHDVEEQVIVGFPKEVADKVTVSIEEVNQSPTNNVSDGEIK